MSDEERGLDDSLLPDTLGFRIDQLWKNRALSLSTDFAVAGWLLSIDPIIFEDASKHSTAEAEEKLRNVSRKLYSHLSPTHCELAVTQIMETYRKFCNKLAPFDNAIDWNNKHAIKKESHLWHFHVSYPKCRHFAFVACRITSKILGIGSCERSFGDVKIMPQGKRVALGTTNMKMQATLYGAHAIENSKARVLDYEHQWGPDDLNDDIFITELDSFMEYDSQEVPLPNVTQSLSNESNDLDLFDPFACDKPAVKVFKCYLEDWEKMCTQL